ncbi:hypothetical protein [Novosphingobium sp.]|uniref:hypothetical protein n=1 Tax=Novosphingobium sp. TaxID=1874826 RepID=UPI002FDF870A
MPGYPVALMPSDCGDLMGSLYYDFYSMPTLSNEVYAAAGVVGIFSGITGRAFNINGAGTNQYIFVVGETGTGKDTMAYVTAKLFNAIGNMSPLAGAASMPTFNDFRGPGELVSSAGLIKWLEKKPCTYSILGEIGLLMQQMCKPNAPPNLASLMRVLLQIYSKSGNGNTFDPSAYSDTAKNTASIRNLSYTLCGETTGSTFYPTLTEGMVSSGFLPRCLLFESTAPRPQENDRPPQTPSDLTVRELANLAAQALNLGHQGIAQNVRLEGPAKDLLADFGRHATDCINSGGEVARQLWNRARLKALKLAALPAISRNMHDPGLILSDAEWACNLVNHQTEHLIGKFDRNETGAVDGDEAKQRSSIIRIVAEYMSRDYTSLAKYEVAEEMHRRGIITHSYLSRRLFTLPAFKDRLGPTAAIKRVIGRMLEDDELREVPPKQMLEQFGSKPKAYVMSDTKPFLSVYKS